MNHADLRAWQASLGLNNAQACKALDVGQTTYYAWLAGEREPGRVVALACAALLAGLEPYGKSDCKNNKNISANTAETVV